MPRRLNRALAVFSLLALLVVTGCSVGPSQRPAVAFHESEQQVPPEPPPPRPEPVPPLGPPSQDALAWQDCTDETRSKIGAEQPPPEMDFECSRLLTTLDSPEEPVSGVTRTALLKTGTGDIPLVVLSGIHGERGTTAAARMATRLPDELLNTFSIIGLDRRGTGESDPADCVPQHQRERMAGFDPRATERAQLDELLDSARNASQQCLLTLDERLQAYDSLRTSSDLEELRRELGVPKLHMLARGEASRVATTYAERYPESVGRTVLDGGFEPERDAIGLAESEARTAEETFDVFASECRDSEDCPLGPEPRSTVQGVVERARTEALPAPATRVPAGRIIRAIQLGLSDRSSWPVLARALVTAERGDGSGIAAMTEPLVSAQGSVPARLDGQLITGCNDMAERVPPERITDLAGEWVDRFPLFGGVAAQQLAWCSQWPAPQEPLPEPRGADLPPVSVISTEHDPYLPGLGSDHLAQQLSSGVLIRWLGASHGAIGQSGCVTGAVLRFLVDGTTPTDNMVCPP